MPGVRSWMHPTGSPYLLSADGKGSVTCWDLSPGSQFQKSGKTPNSINFLILVAGYGGYEPSIHMAAFWHCFKFTIISCRFSWRLPNWFHGWVISSRFEITLRPFLGSYDPVLSFDAHDKGISQAVSPWASHHPTSKLCRRRMVRTNQLPLSKL